MIIGAHAIIYSKDAEATRAFLRDTLRLRSVDAGGGWLIFALPPAELAAHPDAQGGRHELYLMCDDVHRTVAELTRKGVEFTRPIADRGWGLLTAFNLPGAGELWLYQPKHPMAIAARVKSSARAIRRAARKPARRAIRKASTARRRKASRR